MDYLKIYERLVDTARSRLVLPEYFESHHIVPKCLGGGDGPENRVNFTAREHFVSHKLLCKIYPESLDLKLAVIFLSGTRNAEEYVNKNSRSYERFRLEYAAAKRESCRRAGALDLSVTMKVPVQVTSKTRHKLKTRNTRALNLVVSNVLATGGIGVSRKTGTRSLSVMVNGSWRKVASVLALWKVIDLLESKGYVTIEKCPDTIPLAKRKRAAVYPTQKLLTEFAECVPICQENYKNSLVLTKFKYNSTGEIFYANPHTK